jgi:uncharacterized protein YoxC
MSSTSGIMMELVRLKKQFGIQSWIEMTMIFVTLYMMFVYLVSFSGFAPPMTSIIGIGALSFCCYQVFLLSALSERLEKYAKLNEELKETRQKLETNVEVFKKQNIELKGITDGIAQENEQFKSQIKQLNNTFINLERVKSAIEAFGKEANNDLGEVMKTLNKTLAEQKEVK